MKNIKNGIVYSDDIERILNGTNALDYKYEFIPNEGLIREVRTSFKEDTKKIFNNLVTIISEEEMLLVNNFIDGKYPHCNVR